MIQAADGDFIVGGASSSLDFPVTAGAFQTVHYGGAYSDDGTMAKISDDGTSLRWATYLGRGSSDQIEDVALLEDGSIVAYGQTRSAYFPVTEGALQNTLAGGADLFITRFTSDVGALIWSTLLGGTNYEFCIDMAVAASNAIVVSGSTQSLDFPVTTGAFDRIPSEDYTGFVAQVADDGTHIMWSSFVGGQLRQDGLPCDSEVWAMDVAGDGSVWMAGTTNCVDFPVSADGYDQAANGGYDAFVLALSTTGSSRIWGSYLGGSADEAAQGLAFDSRGRLALGSSVWSSDFPVTAAAYDATSNGGADAAVTLFRMGPVPVSLKHFEAHRTRGMAVIQWLVNDMDDVTAFEIWRAGPDQARRLLGTVPRNETGQYEFVDDCPPVGQVDYWLRVAVAGDKESWHGPAWLEAAEMPGRLALAPVAPNPFNPRTTISYALPQAGQVELAIYDLQGRLVRRLLDEVRPAGEASLEWDGLDGRGNAVSSGVYLVRLRTEQEAVSQKVVLAR